MPVRLKIKELESPDWLRQRYLEEGLTLEEIGKLLGCSRSPVKNRLEKFGVPRRDKASHVTSLLYKDEEWLREQYCEKWLSAASIASLCNVSRSVVAYWLKCYNILPNYYKWNDKFFDDLSPDGAYIIGFWIAEGSMSAASHRSNLISFSQKNGGILKKIAKVLSVREGYGLTQKDGSHILSLSSKYTWSVLVKRFGLPTGRQKSYTVRIPNCILERDDLLPHCIRGIFDGDGSTNERGTRFLFSSGSLELLNDIVNVLTRLVSLPNMDPCWRLGGYIKKNGEKSGAYTIDYIGVLDAIDFAKFIYGPDLDVYGSTLHLERKRKCFQFVCDRWHGREWLRKQIDDGKTNKDIAIETDIPVRSVGKVLNGIGVYDFPYKDPKWLWSEFIHNGRSIQDIAETYSIEPASVKYYVNKYALYEARSKSGVGI